VLKTATVRPAHKCCARQIHTILQEVTMGRGMLLWLLGVPIPVIILIMLLFR
jgi:hypothetical protein